MKIIKPYPKNLTIRIAITKEEEVGMYINLKNTTKAKVMAFIKKIIKTLKLDPEYKGHSTRIVVREYANGKNGKSQLISIKGISVKKVHSLIIKEIKLLDQEK